MNNYIFDSSALMHLFDYYYESRFPTLWEYFYQSVKNGQVISVREVRNEIEGHHNKERRINQWVKQKFEIFTVPTLEELAFVRIPMKSSSDSGLKSSTVSNRNHPPVLIEIVHAF